MTISTLPTPPARSDAPDTFVSRADAFMAALPNMVTELNAFGAALNNLATNGTSSTSLLIGTGSKSLTADTGKSWQVGMVLRLAYTTTPTTWMSGTVTAYDSSTGAMTINIDATSGSGTQAAWTISAAASGGATLANIQSGATVTLGSVAGTNTITGTASPTLGAYAAGQKFRFTAAASNTGAVTLNIDGLGAKSVTRDGSIGLRANAILAGAVVEVAYDGTRFQLLTKPQRVTPGPAAGTSDTNVAVSVDGTAGAAISSGTNIVCVGQNAGNALANVAHCTAIGSDALKTNVSAANQTAVGSQALKLSTGVNNTAVGANALTAVSTGAYNTAIGQGAGSGVNSGINNTMLGNDAGANVTTGTNVICIGYNSAASAAGASNEATIGNGITTLRCGTGTITVVSDQRDKTDIIDLALGLDFLLTVRPVRFEWNRRDGTRVGDLEAGFIAQELQSAQETAGAGWLGLVKTDNPDRLEATPGKLLPIIVRAVQELAAENAALRARLDAAGVP